MKEKESEQDLRKPEDLEKKYKFISKDIRPTFRGYVPESSILGRVLDPSNYEREKILAILLSFDIIFCMITESFYKGGHAFGVYKARFPAWLSCDS